MRIKQPQQLLLLPLLNSQLYFVSEDKKALQVAITVHLLTDSGVFDSGVEAKVGQVRDNTAT